MAIYYTLLTRDTPQNPWGVAYGDYNIKVVRQERGEYYYMGVENLKIIATGDTQAEIQTEIDRLNNPIVAQSAKDRRRKLYWDEFDYCCRHPVGILRFTAACDRLGI